MLPKRLSPAVKTFRQQKVAETSSAILLPKRLVPKRPEPLRPTSAHILFDIGNKREI